MYLRMKILVKQNGMAFFWLACWNETEKRHTCIRHYNFLSTLKIESAVQDEFLMLIYTKTVDFIYADDTVIMEEFTNALHEFYIYCDQ